MNRLGDQFFSCTGFALNQYCGIGRCDSFNLFEHGFECRALAYDSLELLLVAKPECFEVPHNYPPNQPRYIESASDNSVFKAVRTQRASQLRDLREGRP